VLFILLGESRYIAASGSDTKNRDVQQKEITLVHTKLCASGPRWKALAWLLPQCRQQATAPGAPSSHRKYVWHAQGTLSSSDVLVLDAFSSWKIQLLRSVAWKTCYEIRCSCLPSNASISTEGTCMLFIWLGESRVIAARCDETKNQAVQQKEIILVHIKLCASGPRLKALAWSLPQCRQQATAPGARSSHRIYVWHAQGILS
jgi:hypothetical protein